MDFGHPLNLAAELETAPVSHETRKAERAETAIAAGLRQRGTGAVVAIRIIDMSTSGFRAAVQIDVMPGTEVWLKLPGLESLPSRVVWMKDYSMGCEFARPLHPAVLANLLARMR